MSPLKQILITVWILLIASLAGLVVVGAFKRELLGYIAFGILPAAVLANLSIIISYTVRDGSHLIAKAVWLFLTIAAIVIASVVVDPQHPRAAEEAEIIIGYSMCTLSFPSCFLIVYFYFGLGYLSEHLGASNLLSSEKVGFYLFNFVSWFGFFLVGYYQWFKLLPYLLGKWRSKRV